VCLHSMPKRFPKALVGETGPVASHDLKSAQELAATVRAKGGTKGHVGAVKETDVSSPFIEIDPVASHEWLQPEVDQDPEEAVLLMHRKKGNLLSIGLKQTEKLYNLTLAS